MNRFWKYFWDNLVGLVQVFIYLVAGCFVIWMFWNFGKVLIFLLMGLFKEYGEWLLIIVFFILVVVGMAGINAYLRIKSEDEDALPYQRPLINPKYDKMENPIE